MNKHLNYFSVAYFTSNSFEKQALSTATTNKIPLRHRYTKRLLNLKGLNNDSALCRRLRSYNLTSHIFVHSRQWGQVAHSPQA